MFRRRKTPCIVVGAPKGNKVLGQVYIYSYSSFPYQILKIFNGNQFGAYFGHTLLVANNDLFISAPMYNVKVYEEGCVYIFDGSVNDLLFSQKICGLKPGGRFGFSMTHLGGIGSDLFNVVAISAPYEEEGSGVVHLYSKIDNTYIFLQKIRGRSVYDNIRGFGFSLSNALDIDQYGYTDFAVGAYLSSSVIVFTSKPILRFSSKLTPNVTHIQDDVNAINLTYCYAYKGLPKISVLLTYNIITDDRLEVQKNNYQEQIDSNKQFCNSMNLKLKANAHYNPYPIVIKILNKLEECPSCPIVYPNDTTVELEIPSATGCGKDAICMPQLAMTNSFQNLTHFVVGSRPSLPLIVEIENNGETAYHCKLNLSLTAEINQIPAACSRHENVIICDISNRFGNKHRKVLQFDVDLKNVYNQTESIIGIISAFSVGEGDGKMVNATINLPLVYISNLTIIGHSSPEYLVYNPEKKDLYNIRHQYIIFNNGPSPLLNKNVMFLIPQNISNMKGEFKNIFDVSVTGDNLCTTDDMTLKRKRDTDEVHSIHVNTIQNSTKFSIDCGIWSKLVQCRQFICDLEILANHSSKIDLLITVDLNLLVKTYNDINQEKDLIIFESSSHYNAIHPKISTFFYTKIAKQTVAIWIWVVSVILALLILTLIIYALYKLHFFKRRDVQTLVNEDEDLPSTAE